MFIREWIKMTGQFFFQLESLHRWNSSYSKERGKFTQLNRQFRICLSGIGEFFNIRVLLFLLLVFHLPSCSICLVKQRTSSSPLQRRRRQLLSQCPVHKQRKLWRTRVFIYLSISWQRKHTPSCASIERILCLVSHSFTFFFRLFSCIFFSFLRRSHSQFLFPIFQLH